ncbi:MAG: hypothetical protein F6J97_04205 [Leptolyngbya sp. SIO4C1]|nr:hypothetical protein [Leptolyngbya sp. SIO4C1]
MKYQLLGCLALLGFLAVPAQAIEIETDSVRIQIGDDREISVETDTLDLDVEPYWTSESRYRYWDRDRWQDRPYRSFCREQSSQQQRQSDGSIYTQSTVTRVCQ